MHIYTCNITPHYELHISVQSASQQKKNETIKVKKIKSEITNNKTLFFNMHITDFKSWCGVSELVRADGNYNWSSLAWNLRDHYIPLFQDPKGHTQLSLCHFITGYPRDDQ